MQDNSAVAAQGNCNKMDKSALLLSGPFQAEPQPVCHVCSAEKIAPYFYASAWRCLVIRNSLPLGTVLSQTIKQVDFLSGRGREISFG